MSKNIHIISGGTFSPIATHLSLGVEAFGRTGVEIKEILHDLRDEGKCKLNVLLHETRMAGGSESATWMPNGGQLRYNSDVEALLGEIVADPNTKIVFMPVALCDFEAIDIQMSSGNQKPEKNGKRLKTRENSISAIIVRPAKKLIPTIRKNRKDIFLVGFKTTDGVSEDEQYRAGLGLLKEASCNLVLANDVKTRVNMVITPEEARYHVTTDRYEALKGLVEMALLRSHLTFTRSTVIAGESVPWDSPEVPQTLRAVVDHLIARGAYKPFRGATVGHFAAKISDTEFLTSKRKTNFNDLKNVGLVRIKTDGPDTVIAYGSKPSVGGQSQRIVFQEHPEYDCIVHAHVPFKPSEPFDSVDPIPTVSQREFECGSHQCGQNTSTGLKKFGNLSAVFLDQHGPNVVFHHSIDPQEVIDFIEANFDLEGKTGGHVS